MATIYENDTYLIKKNRIYPKTGLPILNKLTNETKMSLYPYTDDKSLHLSLKNIAKINLNCNKSEFLDDLTEDEFRDIFDLARKHAIESDRNLFVDSDIASKFDVQNFIGYEKLSLPFKNAEILSINQNLEKPVDVRIPSDMSQSFHFTKARTDEHKLIFKSPYIVSTGKLNLDINANHEFNRISIRKHNNDYSNILSISNTGEQESPRVVFNNKDERYLISEYIYKMPKDIGDNINAIIGLSTYIGYRNHNGKSNNVHCVPKEVHDETKKLSLSEADLLERSIELVHCLNKGGDRDDRRFKHVDNIIGLYKENSYLFKEYDAENKFKRLKELRNEMCLEHDNTINIS